jgi:serine/threonine kinase 38
MEQTRSWFNRFQPRDRAKGSSGKMKVGSAGSDSGKESVKSSRDAAAEELPSSITRQKVAAAKQYIENHYKSQMKSLQERKERRWSLERKLADAEVTEEEQNNLLKDLERRETEYMRLQRHKMGVDDFELLTIIGRGAFGEVFFPSFSDFVQLFDEWF